MIIKITNIIFQLGLYLVLIFLFASSLKVIYNNVIYFNIIKNGVIIDIDSIEGALSDNERGIYINTILLGKQKDTVYAGSQNFFSIGDKVEFRYLGKGGNRIFKVNNKIISSKYGIWDWASPFIFLFTSFLLYKFVRLWFSKIKN